MRIYLLIILVLCVTESCGSLDIDQSIWSIPDRMKCVTTEMSKLEKIDQSLSCFWVSASHNVIFLGKIEVISWNPILMIIRDFLTDKEREKIIETAQPSVKRALVQDKETMTQVPSQTRVADGAWLQHDTNKIIKQVTQKVQDMTGFNTKTAEMWNALFYERGGHYSIHHDMLQTVDPSEYPAQFLKLFKDDLINCWEKNKSFICIWNLCKDVVIDWWNDKLEDKMLKRANKILNFMSGNRIATLILYLEMPALGGGTIFPQLNVTLLPEPGDAVFWFNIRPDGTKEELTYHGACPVVYGQKRIATLWLNTEGQELVVTCPNERTNYDISCFQTGLLKNIIL